MEVKPGYKQTDAGIIPDDWDMRCLGEITLTIGDGIHATPHYSNSTNYHFINGNNLVNGSIRISDTTMCVSKDEWLRLRKNLSSQTILMSINGTIGNLAFYKGETILLGKSAAYLTVSLVANKEYVYYVLSTSSMGKYFEDELTGTTIRNLSLASLRDAPLALPPLSEQRAIATALSDVDALLAAQDKLITKKQGIKQAAMQELLTGKRRLPGFAGAWDVKRLGEVIADISDGGTPSTSNPDNFGGGICWVVIDDIKDEIFETKSTLTGRGLNACSSKLWPPGTVILSTGATIGEVGITKVPTATKQGICGIIVNKNATNAFLKYWLAQNKQLLLSKAQGSSIKEVRPPTLIKLEIALPTVDEQTAIAAVLSDMDAEITALTQKQAKTRALKQGMMQELLTGKTRLV